MNTSDNCGTGCTTGSACAFLWEDDATKNREYATKYRIFFACLLVIDKGGPIMKKVFCLVVLLSMALTMFFPVNASHVDEHLLPRAQQRMKLQQQPLNINVSSTLLMMMILYPNYH